ncbi:MAG: nuclear transport factor 2 family protein [Pseudomonadota bacterium]
MSGSEADPATDVFTNLIESLARAIASADAEAFAAQFAPNSSYDDNFYGRFTGRAEIERMVRDHFLKDGEAFRWTFETPVFDGRVGFAAYHFSFSPRRDKTGGARVLMIGTARLIVENRLIVAYDDWLDSVGALVSAGVPAERVVRSAVRHYARMIGSESVREHLTR